MRLLFSLIVILLISAKVMSGVNITGSLPFKAKESIQFWLKDDYITKAKTLIAQTESDSLGNFSIQFSLTQTEQIIFTANQYQGIFYAKPNSNFALKISLSDTLALQPALLEKPLKITVVSDHNESLNNEIFIVDSLISVFYLKNNIYFTQPRSLIKIYKSFKDSVIIPFKNNISDAFVRDYFKYRLADIEVIVLQNPPLIIRSYLQHIPRRNPAAMDFFNNYYRGYFNLLLNGKYSERIKMSVNESHSAEMLIQTMQKADTLQKNDTLREMLALSGLEGYFYDKSSNRQYISMLLSYFVSKAICIENRVLAGNILKNLRFFEKDSPAPDFLIESKKFEKRLSDLKGKYTYIYFYDSSNPVSLAAIGHLKSLYPKWSYDVNFVVIQAASAQSKTLQQALKGFNGYVLYDEDNKVVNLYQIKSLPYSCLVGPDGNISEAPARLPQDSLEPFFKSLKRKH